MDRLRLVQSHSSSSSSNSSSLQIPRTTHEDDSSLHPSHHFSTVATTKKPATTTEVNATAETHGLEAPAALPLAPNLKKLYTSLAAQSTTIHTLSQNISKQFTQLSSLLASIAAEDDRAAAIAASIQATAGRLEDEVRSSLKESHEGLVSNVGVTNRQKDIERRLKNVQDELQDSISGMEGLSEKAVLKEQRLAERRRKARRGLVLSSVFLVIAVFLAWLWKETQ